MYALFIFSIMSKNKILPEKPIFKGWEGTEHKWFLSIPSPSSFVDNSTIDEKLKYFKNYNSNEIVKFYLVDHLIELNITYILIKTVNKSFHDID